MHQRGSPHRKTWLAAALAAGVVAGSAAEVRAAGFAIVEQSASGIGNAFAGGAASAEDASTIFYNPAGLMRLKGTQAIVGAHGINTSFVFDNNRSTHSLTPVSHQELTGDNGGNGGTLGLVPNLYVSSNSGNGWAFGLGVNAPFGLTTDWDKGWVGRYHALKSSVSVIDINPTLAVDLGAGVSLGVGFNAMYMSAELSQAIDFGASMNQPQQVDGKATLTADDWSYGLNVGLLWQVTENSRIGVQYRSRVTEQLDGTAEFDVPDSVRTMLNSLGGARATLYTDTDAGGTITLPDSASLSAYHRFSPQWAAMADATWTHWSVFNELRIKFENPAQEDSVTTENWKDAWRFSAGVTYNPTPAWPIRLGVAYDQTPVPNARHRTPRLPDNDRYWASIGTGYQLASWLSFDVGYTHLFVKDAEIDKEPIGEDASRGGLKGTFENSADIFSAQAVLRW